MMRILGLFMLTILISCQPQTVTTASFDLAQETKAVNQLMNNWHQAATVADEKTFFGSMTADGVYIGTDASERWTKDEMQVWAVDIFKRDTAWAFQTISREVEFSGDGQVAWFDELLETWMDTCRASGVVKKVDDQWLIKHYHLSMAIPNKHVKAYLELIKE